ncbi:MAG TPA: PIG-L deacetylase family protein [Terriglobia bacterium]|nr:PIG-L deacetylase family protein [Terriglobia bacterium]
MLKRMDSTRRELLTLAGRAGIALAAGGSAGDALGTLQADGLSTPTPTGRKLKVIITGGHPGDPEYGCGGTIAHYSRQGHEVVLLYLNNGEWPAEKGGAPANVRMAEASKACEILKARPAYAGQLNGRAVLDPSHFDDYRRILEAERPDVVFTQWPLDNHRDHRAISALTFDAWLQMGKQFALYYYEVSNGEDTLQFSPTHYVDITGTEPAKRSACYAHASQSPDRFYELQDQVAKFRGIETGCKRAEAFILQVQSPYEGLPAASQMT